MWSKLISSLSIWQLLRGNEGGRLGLYWHQQCEVQPATLWRKKKTKLWPAQVFHSQPPTDSFLNTEKINVVRLPGQKLQLHTEGRLSLNVTCFWKQLHVLTQFFAYFKLQTQRGFCSANKSDMLRWLWDYPYCHLSNICSWSSVPPPLPLHLYIITIPSFHWKWWACKTATAKSHSCILF